MQPLTVSFSYSPPDSSRFDSSGNLSPASSQLSSEPEERHDPKSCHPSRPRPSLHSQQSTWDEEEEDEEEVEEALPEPSSYKELKDSSVDFPKPVLANHDHKNQANMRYADLQV